MPRQLRLLLALALAAGCGPGRLSRADGSLEVSPERLDFPRAFVGFPTSARLEVRNTGRAPKVAQVRLPPPFFAPAELAVEGGSSAQLEVSFSPDHDGEARAELELLAGDTSQRVELHGEALAPPTCPLAAPCHAVSFDPATGACVDTLLPDDTDCAPGSVCLEAARCRAGACLGVERSCDDADLCTADSCDGVSGCLHEPVGCPAPSDPCKVAACDPSSGCGAADAPDGTACGPADCVTARVCLAGACQTVPVPEGHVCAQASPCQAEGVCRSKQCEQPPATVLAPAWVYPVPDGRELYFNGLTDPGGNLYWAECPPAAPCELVSATRDGFVRYRVALSGAPPSGRSPPGALALVGGTIVSTLGGGVEARRTTDGAQVWSANLLPHLPPWRGSAPVDGALAESIVDDGQGGLAVLVSPLVQGAGDPSGATGQLVASLSAATGAVRWVVPVLGNAWALAGDEAGNLFAAGASRPDGGWEPLLASWSAAGAERWRVPASGWVTGLSVASGRLVESAGSPGALRATASGVDLAPPDGGFRDVAWTEEAVLDGTWSYQLFSPPPACCAMCSCPALAPQLRLRSFAATDAALRWDVRIAPTSPPSSNPPLVSEVLLTARGEALYARSPNDSYGSSVGEERLEAVSSQGSLRFSCQLPGQPLYDAILYTGAAALVQDRWVIAAQPQCHTCIVPPSPVLTAFDVPGYELAARGWVSQRGNPGRSGRPR